MNENNQVKAFSAFFSAWLIAAVILIPQAHAACTWYDSQMNPYPSQAELCSAKSGVYGAATPYGEGCCQYNNSGVCNVSGLSHTCTPNNCVKGEQQSSGFYDMGTNPAASPQRVGCDGGCTTTFDGTFPAYRSLVGGVYHYFGQGTWTKDGTECNEGPSSPPSTPNTPPDQCSPTQYQGQVNGVTVCIDPSNHQPSNPNTAPPPPSSPDKSNTTTTNPDGSQTTTTITNNNDGTTTTTITNVSPDGKTTTSSSNTTKKDGSPIDPIKQGDFCKANPDNPLCVKQADECKNYPDRVGCSKFGDAGSVTVGSTTIPVSTDYTPVGGAGVCPADVTVRGITFSYQPICNFASAVRPLVIGFAWLSFAFIVAGVVRK